jgi:hypothetical protein
MTYGPVLHTENALIILDKRSKTDGLFIKGTADVICRLLCDDESVGYFIEGTVCQTFIGATNYTFGFWISVLVLTCKRVNQPSHQCYNMCFTQGFGTADEIMLSDGCFDDTPLSSLIAVILSQRRNIVIRVGNASLGLMYFIIISVTVSLSFKA